MSKSISAALKPRHTAWLLVAALLATLALVGPRPGDVSAAAGAVSVTSVTPNIGPSTGGTAVTVVGTNFTGATAVTIGGTALAVGTTAVITDDTHISIPATPAHAAGIASIRVTGSDGTSISPDTAADNFTYQDAPVVTGVSPSGGPLAGGTLVTIGGSGLDNATSVKFGATSVVPSFVSATSLQATSPAHGAGTVDVLVTTPGGTSAVSALAKFTYGAGPVVTAVSPTGGPITGGTPVTIVGSGFTGATAVNFGVSAGTAVVIVNDGQITVNSPGHAAGTVSVTVTTPAGTSPAAAAAEFTYGSAPTVTGVSPGSGNVAGGTLVTVTGTGFTGATSVSFGGTAVAPTVINDTSLTATSPAHAAGTVDVIVTGPTGSSANTAADNFIYTAGPTVTAVAPTSGPTAGGTAVTITGTGFTGATSVTFGGTAATALVVVNSTTITATSPAHAAGTVDVLVTTPLGTSPNTVADNFVYGSGPVITSVSPNTGPIAGGTAVTITGTGFTGATNVTFDTTSVTPTVNSDTSITVTAPAHAAGHVDISVTTALGTSANTAADDYTYGSATVVYSLFFRWTLLVWSGPNGADITTMLKGLESPDNPATNDVSGSVTAIFRYNNSLQKFEGFFPGSAGVPGANDFTTFAKGQPYWIASSGPGTITWTSIAG